MSYRVGCDVFRPTGTMSCTPSLMGLLRCHVCDAARPSKQGIIPFITLSSRGIHCYKMGVPLAHTGVIPADRLYRVCSLFILVMCILLQCISNPHDFLKYICGKISLWRKELIAQKLPLRGKIKKERSRAHVCSLEQRAGTAHDQNEQTLQPWYLLFIWRHIWAYIATTKRYCSRYVSETTWSCYT